MRKGAVSALLAFALILSGCSAEPGSAYSSDTAITLQTQVLDITAAAAADDPALAMMRLNELAAMANDALVRGQITEARRDSILSAILLVKFDLEKILEAAQLRAEEAARAAEELSGEVMSNDGSNDNDTVTNDTVTNDTVTNDSTGGSGDGPGEDGSGTPDSGDSDSGDSDSVSGNSDRSPEGESGSEGDSGEPGDERAGEGEKAKRGDNPGRGEEKAGASNSARGESNPGRGNRSGRKD